MKFSEMSKFQLIVMAVLIAALVGAIALFALTKTSGGRASTVVVWGTLPSHSMATFLESAAVDQALAEKDVMVEYVQKDPTTVDSELVNALANGTAPDAFILTQDAIVQYGDKTIPIPYSSYSRRDFQDTFIQEAELLLAPEGIRAVPFAVDPMVMYWNRDTFFSANITNPPATWTELYVHIPKINKVDANHNILKSTVAFGTFSNINHAKDILSMLILQAGSPITVRDDNGNLRAALTPGQYSTQGAEPAVNFFTQFADPSKSIYSWNSSLPPARDAFVAGDVALYFGYASELGGIAERNPNLNFDVALMPQTVNTSNKVTYGNLFAVSILRSAKDPEATLNAIIALTQPQAQANIVPVFRIPPVIRSLLAQEPADPYLAVFYNAALISKGWLDPNRQETAAIFSSMIQSVVSGANKPSEAVTQASNRLSQTVDQSN